MAFESVVIAGSGFYQKQTGTGEAGKSHHLVCVEPEHDQDPISVTQSHTSRKSPILLGVTWSPRGPPWPASSAPFPPSLPTTAAGQRSPKRHTRGLQGQFSRLWCTESPVIMNQRPLFSSHKPSASNLVLNSLQGTIISVSGSHEEDCTQPRPVEDTPKTKSQKIEMRNCRFHCQLVKSDTASHLMSISC